MVAVAPVLLVGYVVSARRIADRRMILSGFRLADLLTRSWVIREDADLRLALRINLSGSARGEQYYCRDCSGSALPGKILPFSPLATSVLSGRHRRVQQKPPPPVALVPRPR
jgi:hypothetical protein